MGLAFVILGGVIYGLVKYVMYLLKKIDAKDSEIKLLYELQGKEYKANLEIMARNADIMKQIRTVTDNTSFLKNPEVEAMAQRQKAIQESLKLMDEQIKKLIDGN